MLGRYKIEIGRKGGREKFEETKTGREELIDGYGSNATTSQTMPTLRTHGKRNTVKIYCKAKAREMYHVWMGCARITRKGGGKELSRRTGIIHTGTFVPSRTKDFWFSARSYVINLAIHIRSQSREVPKRESWYKVLRRGGIARPQRFKGKSQRREKTKNRA